MMKEERSLSEEDQQDDTIKSVYIAALGLEKQAQTRSRRWGLETKEVE